MMLNNVHTHKHMAICNTISCYKHFLHSPSYHHGGNFRPRECFYIEQDGIANAVDKHLRDAWFTFQLGHLYPD